LPILTDPRTQTIPSIKIEIEILANGQQRIKAPAAWTKEATALVLSQIITTLLNTSINEKSMIVGQGGHHAEGNAEESTGTD
jgi:hypothetical protein